MKRILLAVAVLLGIAAYLALAWLLTFGAGALGYLAAVSMGYSDSADEPSVAIIAGLFAGILGFAFAVAIPVVFASHGLFNPEAIFGQDSSSEDEQE